MPRLSVFFIRAALLHLATGFTIGSLMLANKGTPFLPELWRLLPLHMECLLIGWMVGLTMGVAFWIMPRFATAPRFGRVRLGWAALALINAGVIAAGVGQVVLLPTLTFAGRLSETAAIAAFIVMIFPRVKPMIFPSD